MNFGYEVGTMINLSIYLYILSIIICIVSVSDPFGYGRVTRLVFCANLFVLCRKIDDFSDWSAPISAANGV
jgi:hypothetical protein